MKNDVLYSLVYITVNYFPGEPHRVCHYRRGQGLCRGRCNQELTVKTTVTG